MTALLPVSDAARGAMGYLPDAILADAAALVLAPLGSPDEGGYGDAHRRFAGRRIGRPVSGCAAVQQARPFRRRSLSVVSAPDLTRRYFVACGRHER